MNKVELQKMMVGHFIENIPNSFKKNVAYVMQGDGVYEVRKNKIGEFIAKIAECEIPGLENYFEEGYTLFVPKIPISLLWDAIAFFKEIYKKYSSEVFLQFFYDEDEEEYFIHCPQQEVTGASVNYVNDEVMNSSTLVFEIHSHGNMGAFFSGTDDGDEKADRFYGVVGNINDFLPEIKMRVIIGNEKISIKICDLFDTEEQCFSGEFPEEWLDRVQKKYNIETKSEFQTKFNEVDKTEQYSFWEDYDSEFGYSNPRGGKLL